MIITVPYPPQGYPHVMIEWDDYSPLPPTGVPACHDRVEYYRPLPPTGVPACHDRVEYYRPLPPQGYPQWNITVPYPPQGYPYVTIEWNITVPYPPQGYPHLTIEYECTVTDILTPGQLNTSGLHPSDWPHPQKPKTEAQSSDNKGETPPESADSARGSLEAEAAQVTDWPVYVRLSNGRVYGCDVVVSATGVSPNTGWLREAVNNDKELKLAEDGGIIVDSEMRSSVRNVYAAGDVCSVDWREHSRTWFPVSSRIM